MGKNKKPPRDRVDLRVEPELIARAEVQAARMGLSLSAYIRMATSERIERDERSHRDLNRTDS